MAFKTFVVDRTPPEITIDGVYDGQMVLYEELTPVINVTDNLDSSPNVTINLNGIPFTSGTTITEVGIYALNVNAVDASGNSTSVSIQFTIANEQMWIDNMKQMITDLPDDVFKNNPDQRKNALINDLNAVLQQINTQNYKGAIQKLQNDIRAKMDGCFGGNANNDWIVDCEAQEMLLERIDRLIEYLQGLGFR